MIRALAVASGCLVAGQLIVALTGLPFPPSILGLGLLFALLKGSLVKVELMKPVADTLMRYLSLFLVPPCVAVINHLGLMRANVWSIGIATVVSTLLVLIVTGKTHAWLRKWL